MAVDLAPSLSRQGHPKIAHRFIGGKGVPARCAVPAGTTEVSPAEPPSNFSPPSPTNARAVFRPWRDCSGHRSLVPPLKRWAIFNRPYRDAEAASLGYQTSTKQLGRAI